MKQIMLFTFALLFLSIHASAQEMDTRKERKRIKTEQKQLRQLELNDNQGQQVKEINARYRDAHKRILQNDGLTQQQKQEQIQALNKKRVEEIHGVVGADNKQAFDRILENEKNKQHMKAEKNNQRKEKKNKKG